MGEYHELIKNFEKVRDYMRQFFVYGYKVRGEFTDKSARTYDNERRRIESYLGGFVQSGYTAKGKQVFLSVDSRRIAQNPLYAAWKAKAFTDNDLLLHFLIPEVLGDGEGKTAAGLADAISAGWGLAFDTQTVRLKLKEYEEEGLVTGEKRGKTLLYRLSPPLPIEGTPLYHSLLCAAAFFQGTAPFGFIGSTILERAGFENRVFRFKHQYLVHTLEDGVLYDMLCAAKEGRAVSFENHSSRTGSVTLQEGVPLKIFVSTRTGRRYLCLYNRDKRRFLSLRLDCAARVRPLGVYEEYTERMEELERNLPYCYGTSFQGSAANGRRLEEIFVKLSVNEEREGYVLERLHREGRGGEIIKAGENTFLYSGTFFDTNELSPWIKTFTGRILDIQGTNSFVVSKLMRDLDRMYEMYCKEEEPNGAVF